MDETINQVEIVRQEVMPIPEQAQLIRVIDQSSLERANSFFLTIKALRKKISATFDPIISKANAAHKEALLQKSQVEAPLILAEKWLNGQVTIYHQEIERKRQIEAEIARQEAIKAEMERRKKEEEIKLAQAAELEKVGAIEEAESLITETVEENEKPLEIYTSPPETPKVKLEGVSIREYWHAEVTDLRALCKGVAEGRCPLAYIEPNMPTLNTLAGRLKKEFNVPGVKAVSRSSMASTGRR